MAPVHPVGTLLPSSSASASPMADGLLFFANPPRIRSARCLRPRVSWAIAAGLLLATFGSYAQGSAAAVHQHAHVHGVAQLGIAIQDKTVTISLESPLDSVIGFEHRANTPAQQSLIDALQARMKAPQDLFRFDPGAACTLTKSEAESAIFQPAPVGDASEEHADLDASFEYSCAHPDKLTMLDVGLFQAYPRLKRLDIEVATGQGQFKRNLASPERQIALVR
jgi:hypothetical protein